MPLKTSTDAAVRTAVDNALKLGRAGQHQAATRGLLPLARHQPTSGAVRGVLGKLYFESGDFRRAAKWFRLATEVSPRSELASLGLFHSLWELNRRRAALAEMSRFLSVAECADYTAILHDLAVAGVLTLRREAAGAA